MSWTIVVLPLSLAFGYYDSEIQCLWHGEKLKMYAPEFQMYCVPRKEWDQGKTGLTPEREIMYREGVL